jgi:hypothetical protein
MIIAGHLGSGVVDEYTVEMNGVPFDLAAANVLKLQVVVEGFAIDSVSNPELVSFDTSTVKIKWGSIVKPKGGYSPTIYAYYENDDEGTVLYGPGKYENIDLTLVEDERPST